MSSRTFTLRPISYADADALRRQGDPAYVADGFPRYPCRQCLKDAAARDALILVSHDPFETDSEYRSASPIFLHRDICGPATDAPELPEQLTCRHLSVRSFDHRAMMIDAKVIAGDTLENNRRAPHQSRLEWSSRAQRFSRMLGRDRRSSTIRLTPSSVVSTRDVRRARACAASPCRPSRGVRGTHPRGAVCAHAPLPA